MAEYVAQIPVYHKLPKTITYTNSFKLFSIGPHFLKWQDTSIQLLSLQQKISLS